MKKVVIYPGRFQPMLSHHAEVFKQLKAQFPDADIYVGSSDKVEAPDSPFSFKEKQLIATAHGIPANHMLQATRPYHKDDYARYFDENNTIIIFAVGEKDLDRFPFNNVDAKTGLDMTVKGEPRPKYYQKINTLNNNPQPMSTRGYITLAPTIPSADGSTPASASAFRSALKSAPDIEAAKEIYSSQFGQFNDKVFNLIYNKITGANMSEQINIMRKLAGLPVQEAAPVEFTASADAKTAKFLPPSTSSAKMSIANRFPKGADINDPKVKQEQFVQALLRSPEALIAEFSERLDPKDDNSLAVGQKLSDIVQYMNQKDTGVAGLPREAKQFVLDLAVNAVKNMKLVAGDDSPAYSDMEDDEDEFKKESVDLSSIRDDYGVNESKPDFLDLDKDGNKKEPMKKAAKDKKVSEGTMRHGIFSDNHDEAAKAFSDLEVLMSSPLPAIEAADKLYDIVFDDELFDIIGAQADDSPEEDLTKNVDFHKRLNYLVKWAKGHEVNEAEEDDEDDESWIPSEDEFDQEIKHGYKGRTTEGFSSEADMVLAKVGSGELDAYDVMTRPQGPAQAQAAEIIQSMYDDVAADNYLHPDDDFEKILDIVTDQLDKDYGDSDAETREAVNPYAVGMASAMKSTGDKPPLSKRTIKKAHKIAKAVAKNEAVDETTNNAVSAALAELRKLAGLR